MGPLPTLSSGRGSGRSAGDVDSIAGGFVDSVFKGLFACLNLGSGKHGQQYSSNQKGTHTGMRCPHWSVWQVARAYFGAVAALSSAGAMLPVSTTRDLRTSTCSD